VRDDSGDGGECVRRLRRILFNSATALSLALVIAVVVLWVRSYRVSDSIYRSRWWSEGPEHNESAWWLIAGRGRVEIGHRRQQIFQALLSDDSFLKLASFTESFWKQTSPAGVAGTPFQPEGFFQRLGFRYVDEPNLPSSVTPNNYYREWNAPLWSLLLLCAPLPVVRLGSALRRRRARGRGLCPACGYDLRATPERCPECGTAAAMEGVKA
jgi:hypothetical protein